MIGYVCKYTPVELLKAMGADPVRIDPQVSEFTEADTLMHPNTCSYAKSVLEEMKIHDYEGIVLTTCCDSIRRLYDTLCQLYPDKFFYLLDIPRKMKGLAGELYTKQLLAMVEAYGEFTGEPLEQAAVLKELKEILKRQQAEAYLKKAPTAQGALRIGIMGARCPMSIRELLLRNGAQIAFDLTCTGMERSEQMKGRIPRDTTLVTMQTYGEALLNQVPCSRMVNASGREQFLEGFRDSLDGIVYHTVKFCDSYSYEYTDLHNTTTVPVLKVETDLTRQCEGQIRTRIEAFLESLSGMDEQVDDRIAAGRRRMKGEESLDKILVMGVDSGSTSTNAVIMNGNKELLADVVIRTGAKTSESAKRALDEVLTKAGIQKEDLALIVSTGYGRVSIPYADKNVTEISCHGKGALYFNPQIRTILDIGGQDSKAISLNADGEVTDFVMNDKCAAGTGRFLEAMARTLEVGIEELGPISLASTKEVEISSMCTVFAESEVISLIAQNTEKSDIARGVHRAIAGKAFSLLRRVGLNGEFMMTGGVAKNEGVVKEVEEKIGASLFLCEKPDIVGAVGAALYALEALEAE